MSDFGAALVGGAIPGVIAIVTFVFGYGKLSGKVESLDGSVKESRREVVARLEKLSEDVTLTRERIARQEGITLQRPEGMTQ